MIKRVIGLVMVLVLVLALASCGVKPAEVTSSAPIAPIKNKDVSGNLQVIYTAEIPSVSMDLVKYLEKDTGNIVYLMDGYECSDVFVINSKDVIPADMTATGIAYGYKVEISDGVDWTMVKVLEVGTNRQIYLLDGYESGTMKVLPPTEEEKQ